MPKHDPETYLRHMEQNYLTKLDTHGDVPEGVDWSSTGQRLRFDVTWEEMASVRHQSILDAGCGTGHFLTYLKEKEWQGSFRGFDLLEGMVEVAQKQHPEAIFFVSDVLGVRDMPVADVVVASGLFAFLPFETVQEAIEILWARARKALIFNALSTWGLVVRRGEDVVPHDPLQMVTHCRTLTSWVRLRHDYLPSDFTVTMLKGRHQASGGFSL
jgi:SAM-dependent methyltransferase